MPPEVCLILSMDLSQECAGKSNMKATLEWRKTSSADFGAGSGRWGCAQLRHYTAAYREWGDGPPLVLVPALAGGMDLLAPLAGLLATKFRVICYQLRGEDDCFAVRRRFGLPELVDDLAEFLDWHCLEQPSLLGVSFGGALALEFAVRHPGRLASLAVQGVGARFERSLVQLLATTVLTRYPLPPDNPFVNQFFNLLFGGPRKSGPLADFVIQQCWQTDQSVMAHRFSLVEDFDVGERLNRIANRTLVMVGERDVLVSARNMKSLCEGLPQSNLVRIPASGHFAFVTQPGKVANEVRQFLADETE
jgi:pimeloyl-ACP methyl ester carboxylesterase